MVIRSRWNWMVSVVAAMAATFPIWASAQEYLPPVIDRSKSAERPAIQGRTGTPPAAAPSLEERLVRIERLIDNQALVDMLMRLDTLQTDNQALRGEMETLTHEMEALKQRQRDLYLDIDTRLRKLEEAAAKQPAAEAPSAAIPAPAVPTAVVPSAGVAVAPQKGGGDPAKERDAYQKAFSVMKNGQYEQAITEFQSFLSQYPSGDYADNAQYWLGEANYASRHYDVAVKEFRKLLEQRPGSSKAADATLKLGYAYYELGEWDSARKTLTEVTSRHANTTAARLAESRLQKMRLEGH